MWESGLGNRERKGTRKGKGTQKGKRKGKETRDRLSGKFEAGQRVAPSGRESLIVSQTFQVYTWFPSRNEKKDRENWVLPNKEVGDK